MVDLSWSDSDSESDGGDKSEPSSPEPGPVLAVLVTTRPWSVLQASFRRSDAPKQVAEAFAAVVGWKTAPVQELLWERVLSERAAGGAGSREYMMGVLKAVVSQCDAARAEVAERLVEELLLLQSGAAAKRVTAEAQACSDAVGSTSTAAAPEPEPEGRSSQGEEERRSEEERQSEEEYREMCRLAGRILPREHVWE